MVSIEFEAINERGTTRRLEQGGPLFTFDYTNSFWGSCTLVARVHESTAGLELKEDSVQVESCKVHRGSAAVVVHTAILFFRRALAALPSLDQLEQPAGPFVWLRVFGRGPLASPATTVRARVAPRIAEQDLSSVK